MCSVVLPADRRGRAVRFALVFGLGALVAACSSSSQRFGPNDETASINPGNPYPSAPASSNAARKADSAHMASLDGNGSGDPIIRRPLDDISSQQPPAPAVPRAPAATRAATPAPAPQRARWVRVEPGDTLYSLSRRHGVNVGEMAAANGIAAPYTIKIGQRLRLPAGAGGAGPKYAARPPASAPAPRKAAAAPAPREVAAAPAPRKVAAAPQPGAALHQVRSGETLYAISRRYGVKPTKIASYNGIDAPYVIKPGQRIRIPGATATRMTAAKTAPETPDYKAPTNKVTPAKSAPLRKISIKSARETGRDSRDVASRKPYRGPLPTPEPMTSAKFRWPVKGKIISRFGRKRDGARNDGINIAVPAGTTVRAAENGVVAYAGNELKGYGNLVLVRHTDNWVTAYAHNGELLVRRGDRVKRGQIIAKAGQSGSVSSPQLHFEIRKGAKAIDPIEHMSPSHLAAN